MRGIIGAVIYGLLFAAALAWTPVLERSLMPETHELAYLGGALVLWVLGFRFFGGRFIRPRWKQPGKLIMYLLLSWLLLRWVGEWALVFIIGHQAMGWVAHVMICRRHGIDWRTCEPEEEYLALTEKWARGEWS